VVNVVNKKRLAVNKKLLNKRPKIKRICAKCKSKCLRKLIKFLKRSSNRYILQEFKL